MRRGTSRTRARAGQVLTVVAIAAAGLVLSTEASKAGGSIEGFQSPSGNIHCMYASDVAPDMPASVRCDMQEIDGPAPSPPPDCDGDWGRAFEITHGGQAGQLICISDTVFNEANPKLGYGKTWRRDGFTCTSQETGMSCTNDQGHGFSISRASRKVY